MFLSEERKPDADESVRKVMRKNLMKFATIIVEAVGLIYTVQSKEAAAFIENLAGDCQPGPISKTITGALHRASCSRIDEAILNLGEDGREILFKACPDIKSCVAKYRVLKVAIERFQVLPVSMIAIKSINKNMIKKDSEGNETSKEKEASEENEGQDINKLVDHHNKIEEWRAKKEHPPITKYPVGAGHFIPNDLLWYFE